MNPMFSMRFYCSETPWELQSLSRVHITHYTVYSKKHCIVHSTSAWISHLELSNTASQTRKIVSIFSTSRKWLLKVRWASLLFVYPHESERCGLPTIASATSTRDSSPTKFVLHSITLLHIATIWLFYFFSFLHRIIFTHYYNFLYIPFILTLNNSHIQLWTYLLN